MFSTPHRTVPHRLWAVWVLAVVMALAALAPTVSYALAPTDALMGMPICSSSGTPPLSTDSPAGPESALSLTHCPFCLLPTGHGAPPPHVLPYLFSVLDGFQVPMAWQAFFFSLTFSLTSAPRGPPPDPVTMNA